MRAGAFALSLLSVPINVQTLQALDEHPQTLHDLRRHLGAPPETTMRANLRTLTMLGVLERQQQEEFPRAVALELAAPGRELAFVAEVLGAWLGCAPEGSLNLGSLGAKNAVKALTEGWSTTIIRALAAGPLSLTQLSKLIGGLSYPSLERRLTAMRLAGLIESCPANGRGTPYAVSSWLRLAAGPLAACALWERLYAPRAAPPVGKLDAEALFLLAVPMLRLPEHLYGSCRLAVELGTVAGESRFGGIVVEVDEGRIVSCVSRVTGKADAWVSGTSVGWMRAMVKDESEELEVGGDGELALELVERLHHLLLRAPQRA